MNLDPAEYYRIDDKLRWGKDGKIEDRSVIIINSHLRLTGIPDEAHEYVVNGKSALGWILDQYEITLKDSGIVNDPNEWSDDPAHIVELIKKVVTVSVETVEIVKRLPSIDASETAEFQAIEV